MAGEIQLNSVSLATESGSAITLGSAVSLNSAAYASTSEVQGTHTTGTITTGTTSLTVASGSGISNGDYVVGEGIAPGTTVSAISGTSVTLSGTVGATLSSDPVSFYTANKALSPGLVAGGLCRAWVNFNDSTDVILASFNISSMIDNGNDVVGTFTTVFPDANYSLVMSHSPGGQGDSGFINSLSSTSFSVSPYNYGGYLNPLNLCVAVFR
jgi:hypothetical protein